MDAPESNINEGPLPAPAAPRPPHYRYYALAWIAAFFAIGLLTLKFYPPVNYNLGDEVWALQGSRSIIEGTLTSDLVTPKLYFFLMGIFVTLLKGGIFTARAFTLLTACVALYLTYVLGREIMDEAAGILSSLLLGTSFAFMWHSHIVRHEMMSAAFALGAFLLLYMAYLRNKGVYIFLAGALVTMSITVHPNNLQYVLGILPLYIVLFRRRALEAMSFYLIAGLALGSAFWVAVNFLPYLAASAEVAAARGVAATGTAGASASILSSLPVVKKGLFALIRESAVALPSDYLTYVRRFDSFFPNTIALALPAGAGALICALGLISNARWKVLLPLFFVLVTSFLNYFVTERFGYWHFVEFYPFLAVSMALSILGLARIRGGLAGKAVVVAGTVFFVALGAYDTARAMNAFRGYDYEALLKKVSEKAKGRVLGMDLYAPAYGGGEFFTPGFSIDLPSNSCTPFEEMVRQIGVDHIIADELLQRFAAMGCGAEYEKETMRYLFLKCRQVGPVLASYPNYWVRGRLITEINIVSPPP